MALTRTEARALIEAILATQAEEPACDECLRGVAEFAEAELTGRPIPDAVALVRAHLERCGECREEYEALRRALEALEASESSPPQE